MASKPARWCPKCRKAHSGPCPKVKTWKRTTKTEGKTTTERGYGAAWRRKRKLVIQRDDGLCQPCLRVGIIKSFDAVDHKVPLSQGGSDDENNLQCICNDCHKVKTQSESSVG